MPPLRRLQAGERESRSVDERVERFLASPSLSASTRRAYGVDLRQFLAWLSARRLGLDDVDVRSLADYAAELGRGRPKLAPATIARRLAAVRALLRFALGPERVPDASFSPRRPRRLPEAPRLDEVDAELGRLEGDGPLALRNRALVELVYSAGRRKRALPVRPRPPARYGHAAPVVAPSSPPAPCVRDAPARRRRRSPDDPGATRPQLALDDPGLLPCGRPSPAPRLRSVAPALVVAAAAPASGRRSARRREENAAMADPPRDPELEGFLALLAATRATRTVDAYRRDLTDLARRLGRPLASATTAEIERYL